MNIRRWNTAALLTATMSLMAIAPLAAAQTPPPAGEELHSGADLTGKGEDKGKPPSSTPTTPRPPYVPQSGPESYIAFALLAAAAFITVRYTGKALMK